MANVDFNQNKSERGEQIQQATPHTEAKRQQATRKSQVDYLQELKER